MLKAKLLLLCAIVPLTAMAQNITELQKFSIVKNSNTMKIVEIGEDDPLSFLYDPIYVFQKNDVSCVKIIEYINISEDGQKYLEWHYINEMNTVILIIKMKYEIYLNIVHP